MITKEILTLKILIKKILLSDIYARDNDQYLMFLIWEKQNKQFEYNVLKTLLIKGTLFSPESIRRSRQKTQELHPHTRGYNYFKRHNMQEEMKAVLKEYNNKSLY